MANGQSGFTLSYEERGSGTPLLLIHGFPLSARIWREQLVALSGSFRVIAPDLRGFGKSEFPAGDCTMDDYADDLIGLLDRLGIEKAVVCGMSMGGYVLFNLLERYPTRVAAACFMVTRAGSDDSDGRKRRKLLAGEVLAKGATVVAAAFSKVLFAPQTATDRPELVADVMEIMLTAQPAGLAGGLLAMRERRDYRGGLGDCKLPTLVIGAADDMAMPPEESRQLAAEIPGSELHIIPAAGHMVMLEQPAEVNRLLHKFMTAL